VILAVLSPSRWYATPRLGKDRYTFIRFMKKYVIEVHLRIDGERNAWIINAFKKER
jgi:hypothetical protein